MDIPEDGLLPSLRSREWPDGCSTSDTNLVRDFYEPALARAQRYDRAVGYFRSSFYALTAPAVAAFALAGGSIRVVCAPDLSSDDIEVLQAGADPVIVASTAAAIELSRILEFEDSTDGARVLKALLEYGALEIKVATTQNPGTIFHDKIGLFTDAHGNTLTFAGSVNETWRAWHPNGNHESFEVFHSWDPGDAERVDRHRVFFDDLWEGDRQGIDVVDLREAFADRLIHVGDDEPGAVLTRAAEGAPGPDEAGIRLQKHQLGAVAAWEENDRRGVIKHATGSGKTYTALEAVRRHIEGGKPALIMVPSALLLEQWLEETAIFFAPDGVAVLAAGAGHDAWKRDGSLAVFSDGSLAEPRLIISTLQTASSPDFLAALQGGEHLMVVCDEVHNFGAPSYRVLDAVASGPRLGVSATPERFRDPAGTTAIFEYFGPVVGPVITLEDAVRLGRLCPYDYYVHEVGLTVDEAEEWREVTAKIRRAAALAGGRLDETSEQFKRLLIKRARIAKQAAEKAPLAASIVAEHFRPGQHWLVYCDDREQLGAVLALLRERDIPAMPYWSEMAADRKASMDRFQRSGGVLVAIQCLDEGVDVPALSHGVILASTQNPRQFIQRRGRMLRRTDGKYYAVIHDLVLAPPDVGDADFDSILKAEVLRCLEFAGSAENESCRIKIDALIEEWGVDPTDDEPSEGDLIPSAPGQGE